MNSEGISGVACSFKVKLIFDQKLALCDVEKIAYGRKKFMNLKREE